MTKVDVISGFLGAGKTTLIRKLLKEALSGEKVVLIENEFGEIGIDGGFLKDAGVEITEMNSGCICCSLVGDFGEALKKVIEEYHPDRVIIEPSGVGKLSDVMAAVKKVSEECALSLNSATTVADASKTKIYMKNFGEFYNNQIENAGAIVLSRSQNISEEKLALAVELIREKNKEARILTTPWDDLDGQKILSAMEDAEDLTLKLMKEAKRLHDEEEEEHEHHHHHHHDDEEDEHEHHHHHHHHHDDDEEGEYEHHHHHHHHDDDEETEHEHHHHHHHHDDDEEGEHEHHHHHHHHHDDDEEGEYEHHHHHHHHHDDEEDEHGHHHHHGETCSCGSHHHHDHDGHHHADDVFQSIGVETPKKFEKENLEATLEKLSESSEFGTILRAKGMLPCTDGTWAYFDLVPGEYEIRQGEPEYTGRLCVIGSDLQEEKIHKLFGI